MTPKTILRLPGVAFFYALFGIGCILIPLLIYPCLCAFIWQHSLRARYLRRVVSFVFSVYVWLLNVLGFVSCEIKNEVGERIKGPCIVVSNHPSLIDVVFLIASLKGLNCIVKGALFKNPFTMISISGAGYVNNDSQDLVSTAIEALSMNDPLLIFPEGTRSVPGGGIEFSRGAAHIALKARANIYPVSIKVSPPTLFKGHKIWQITDQKIQVQIKFQKVVRIADYLTNKSQILEARRLTRDLEQLCGELQIT